MSGAEQASGEPRPGERLGPFALEATLGRGQAGVVYRARREDGEEPVALKVLRRRLSADPGFVRRFLREARVAAAVSHPHLVPILEAGEADGWHYLAARYVDGPSLRERLDGEGPLAPGDLARLAAELGAGLDALHAAGLVHRDVKPSNVMLAADGSALLADFGLAKGPAYTVLTRPGELMGTPAYMAPELIDGAEASRATDLYALACLLFEAATGAPPFASPSLVEMVAARLVQDPPDPCAARPELPGSLGRALRLALDRDPEARPATATALARMLAVGAR